MTTPDRMKKAKRERQKAAKREAMEREKRIFDAQVKASGMTEKMFCLHRAINNAKGL